VGGGGAVWVFESPVGAIASGNAASVVPTSPGRVCRVTSLFADGRLGFALDQESFAENTIIAAGMPGSGRAVVILVDPDATCSVRDRITGFQYVTLSCLHAQPHTTA